MSAAGVFLVLVALLQLASAKAPVTRRTEWFTAVSGAPLKAVIEARPDGYGRIIEIQHLQEKPQLYIVRNDPERVDTVHGVM